MCRLIGVSEEALVLACNLIFVQVMMRAIEEEKKSRRAVERYTLIVLKLRTPQTITYNLHIYMMLRNNSVNRIE